MEIDEPLTALVREHLPLPKRARIRVRAADARAGLASLPPGSADVVISDVFAGARTPAHLTTVEYAAEAKRALRRDGIFMANVADGPPLRYARVQAATLRAVFPHVCLLAEPGTFRGRRFGNLVAVASDADLPVAGLTRRCASDPMPARVVEGADLDRFVGRMRPANDAGAVPSPAPPDGVFGR
jgi:spermidine synthase